MRDVLVAIVSASIGIIEVETKVKTLVDIYSKLGVDVVLAVGLVSAVVIINSGIWRQSVHKQEGVWFLVYETVWFVEYKVFTKRTVDVYTTQTCSVVTTCGVVVAIHTTIECGIHIQVW